MHLASASFTLDGNIHWTIHSLPAAVPGDGVTLEFDIRRHGISERQVLRDLAGLLTRAGVEWIQPRGPPFKAWRIDLLALKNDLFKRADLAWAFGEAFVEPEVLSDSRRTTHVVKIQLFPEEIDELRHASDSSSSPSDLAPFLEAFRRAYPDQSRCVFLMMRFGSTKVHDEIVQGVRSAFAADAFVALRADERRFADDLFANVRTYMHGCALGVAVFERLEADEFNPNVSLELGYMLALRKHVCLLKDRTLPGLQTDLVGQLYDPFDPQDAQNSIRLAIARWLRAKGIVATSKT